MTDVGVNCPLRLFMGPWNYLLGTTWYYHFWDEIGNIFFSWLLLNLSLDSVFQALTLEFSRPLVEALLGRFQNTSRWLFLSHTWSHILVPTKSEIQTDLEKLLYPLPQAALVFSGMRRHPSLACQVSNNNSLYVLESKTFRWFLSATSVCVCVCVCSVVSDSVTPWTVAHEAPPSMVFSRQDYWSGLPFPTPICHLYCCYC